MLVDDREGEKSISDFRGRFGFSEAKDCEKKFFAVLKVGLKGKRKEICFFDNFSAFFTPGNLIFLLLTCQSIF